MPEKQKNDFTTINPDAAGIDIASEIHYVAVPADRDEKPVRSFKSYTPDLYKLADWLKECRIKTVAMESTGVYWIPLYQILEERGFEVKLVNARHVKNVPGRKTDIKDCQWLQQLHSFGLLNGSFRPESSICVLRAYSRQRENLIKSAATHILRMQKALSQMNVQLHKVLSDITGSTGRRMITAIISGNHNPVSLAQLKHPAVKKSEDEIAKALTGDYRAEHLFVLKQEYEIFNYYDKKICECDKHIESHMQSFEKKKPEVKIRAAEKVPVRTVGYDPRFDLKNHLYRITGVDLTAIQGINASLGQTIISEIGLDMNQWKSEKHFASWLGLSPNHKISGNKIKSSRTLKVVNRAATAFHLAARSAGQSKSALGAFYRRIKSRSGAQTANTATAHKVARIVYRMLKYGEEFTSQSFEYYEQQYQERIIKNLEKKAKRFGYELVAESPSENKCVS